MKKEEQKRIVISKSKKRRVTSVIEFPVYQDGKSIMKKVVRNRPGTHTEMVVYKTPEGSKTRHQPVYK